MLPAAFWQGVEEFNQKQFYACHDTLEALWMEASEPEKNFYQGILQIAVACYHLGNSNWRGTVILLGEGSRKLREYQPVYENIDVTELINNSSQLLQELQEIEPEQVSKFVEELNERNINNYHLSSNNNYSLYDWPKIVKIEL